MLNAVLAAEQGELRSELWPVGSDAAWPAYLCEPIGELSDDCSCVGSLEFTCPCVSRVPFHQDNPLLPDGVEEISFYMIHWVLGCGRWRHCSRRPGLSRVVFSADATIVNCLSN